MRARFLAVAVAAALWSATAHANPDVWVMAGVTYRFEDNKVSAITFEWQFDEYFSNRTIRAYDANQNGVLDPGEVERLRAEAFEPLRKFDYYVHLWVGDKKLDGNRVEGFTARVDGKKLVYRFTLALSPPADPRAEHLVASLNDKEIYVDFRLFKEKFLLVEGQMAPDCKFRVARGKGAQSGHAQPITLKCGGSI